MILFRYLSREILSTLSAVTGLLLLIFLSNLFVRYLSGAALGKFSNGTIIRLIAIEAPHLTSILLPLGLFLGILLCLGRFYADNEMTVLSACGLSRAKLTALLMPVTLLIITLVAVLNFWLNPHLMAQRDRLLAQTGTAMQIETTLPGRFQATSNGQRIFYVESMSPNKQRMQHIFLSQMAEPTPGANPAILPWIILTAQEGYQTVNPKTGERFLVANNGHRYEGIPGSKDFQIIQFAQYRMRIESQVADIGNEEDAMPTAVLWRIKKDRPMAEAELQWRLSAPLSALLLMLLAIPISRVKPRQGRYAALFPAILIYIIYANFILVGRNWIEQGHLSPSLGLWWIHGSLLLIIACIWLYQIGWRTLYMTCFNYWRGNK